MLHGAPPSVQAEYQVPSAFHLASGWIPVSPPSISLKPLNALERAPESAEEEMQGCNQFKRQNVFGASQRFNENNKVL